jgi:hypothetical protein
MGRMIYPHLRGVSASVVIDGDGFPSALSWIGGGRLRDVACSRPEGVQADHRRGFSPPWTQGSLLIQEVAAKFEAEFTSRSFWSASRMWRHPTGLRLKMPCSTRWIRPGEGWGIYSGLRGILWSILRVTRSILGGGGDQGDFGEESAHPKPLDGLSYLGLSGRTSKQEQYPKFMTMAGEGGSSSTNRQKGRASPASFERLEEPRETDLN